MADYTATYTGSTKASRQRTNIWPYIFVAPFFLLFFAFLLFPILYSVFVSLNDWDGFTAPVFVGFANYVKAIQDPRLLKALSNTLLLMLMIIPIQIFLGFFVANMLNSKLIVHRNAFRLFNFLPYLTAPIALGVIFAIMFDPTFGTINFILEAFGMEKVNWFGRVWPARFLVAAITIWRFYGYTAVLFFAGLTNISPDLNAAAEIDGTNAVQKALYITLPILKPVTTFVVLTTMIGCFQIFEEPFLIFGSLGGNMVGGPRNAVLTSMWLFYDTAFSNLMRYGYASAIAIILFIVIAVMSFSMNKLLGRGGTN